MRLRIFYFFLFIFIFLPAARAQEMVIQTREFSVDTIESSKTVVWGIKGNLSAEIPSKWRKSGESEKRFNSGFGASIGGLMNVYLGKNFYFEPELSLFYEGYSYDNIKQVAPNSPSINAGPKIYKLGVRVPIVFGYFINISEKWGLNVFTGPELSYAFYGDAKSENEEVRNDKDLMSVFSGAYAQRRFDAAWKIGIGFPVDHFLISLESDIGITDMLKNSWTMRENRLGLGISYYF